MSLRVWKKQLRGQAEAEAEAEACCWAASLRSMGILLDETDDYPLVAAFNM
jgi:hypothetical protein